MSQTSTLLSAIICTKPMNYNCQWMHHLLKQDVLIQNTVYNSRFEESSNGKRKRQLTIVVNPITQLS